ncbi:hypothetical protein CN958_00135 [Bacillus cereus]|uniref:Uncharacterized protein n=1 Tax=Bacillus cereus TaxID=1396 RepID=A0A2B9EFB3_BACCE|nr:hypothetical protein CN958_00135 [Bacillus cereus]
MQTLLLLDNFFIIPYKKAITTSCDCFLFKTNTRLRFSLCPAPAARILGGFAPSSEANYASLSGAPSTSYSKRAASAFLYYIFSGADTPTIANAF